MLFNSQISPGDVIAVGDIHGRFDLFTDFLNRVRDSEATVVLLGDMIDRGPQDVEVLCRVKELLDDPESWGLQSFYALMGNHELMMLNASYDPNGHSIYEWNRNGGNLGRCQEIFAHAEWVKELPLYMTIDDTMLIHAGFYPGHDPAKAVKERKIEELLWIRKPFLTLGPEFEKWSPTLKRVVFGHTPKGPLPYTIPGGGICIDTGAYSTGILTSYNLNKNTFWSYASDTHA